MPSGYLENPTRTKREAQLQIVRDYLKAMAADPRALVAKTAWNAFKQLHPEVAQ